MVFRGEARELSPSCRRPVSPAAAAAVQSMSMGGVQLSLRATADKMSKVMAEPHKRRMVYVAGGVAVLLFLVYVWLAH